MAQRRFQAPVAVHLFLIRDGRVLLLRRVGTGYEDGNYSVIAGHLDGGEEVKTAAIREAREEAGIGVARTGVEVVGAMHRKGADERIDFFAVTTRWPGEVVNREAHRCDELAWFPLDQLQLPDNTIAYVQRALENDRRDIWFDSYGWTDPPDGRDRVRQGP